MTTTTYYWPIGGVLPPLKASPWLNNHHHQRVHHIHLIVSILFLLPPAPSSFTITLLGTFDILAHHNTSPPLLPQHFSPPISTIKITNHCSHPRRNNPTHYFILSTFPTSPTYHTSSTIWTPSSCNSRTPLYTHHIPIPTYT